MTIKQNTARRAPYPIADLGTNSILPLLMGAALALAGVLVVPIGSFVAPVPDLLAIVYLLDSLIARYWKERVKQPVKSGTLPLFWLAAAYILTGFATTALGKHISPPFDSITSMVTLIQRTELLIVWLLVGVTLARRSHLHGLLIGFIAVTTAVSFVWSFTPGTPEVFGLNKNSFGGFIATSIILIIVMPFSTRLRVSLLAVHIVGLLSTGSRGALLGLIAALVVAAIISRATKPLGWIISLGLASLITLQLLPESIRARLLSEDKAGSGQWNVAIRLTFIRDALIQWRPSPWTGVGIGNYRQILPELQRIETYDPHNVWMLALVEGGWFLAGAWLLLAATSILLAIRVARQHKLLLLLPLMVQTSILVHATVDVYWTRGTGSMGWLLLTFGLTVTTAHHMDGDSISPEQSPPCKIRGDFGQYRAIP